MNMNVYINVQHYMTVTINNAAKSSRDIIKLIVCFDVDGFQFLFTPAARSPCKWIMEWIHCRLHRFELFSMNDAFRWPLM